MTLHVTAGGRSRVVDVRREGDRFLVSVDGRPHAVDVKEVNGVWSMLVAPARSYEVAFSASADGAVIVHVDGVPVEVSMSQRRRAGTAGASPADGGPQRVTAPMPGKVVKLLVKPGDNVQARQGLIVVEAMKMENELRARAAGRVSEVRVTEGTSVEAGAILVILE